MTADTPDMAVKFTEKQRADAFLLFRRKLREARAVVQADAEAYNAVWDVVESLGDYRAASVKSFVEVVMASYDRLREARNALVHEGAVSRSLGMHAMRLSLAMEEALMTEMTELIDSDVGVWMVPDPVIAQPWQTVSEVRAALLSGGYSVLPLRREEGRLVFRVRCFRSLSEIPCLVRGP